MHALSEQQGWLKIIYATSSIYKISAAHRDAVIRLLDLWSDGAAPTPSSNVQPQLKAVPADPAQRVLPFPGTAAPHCS